MNLSLSTIPSIAFHSTIHIDTTAATSPTENSLNDDYSIHSAMSTMTHPLLVNFDDQSNRLLSHPVLDDHTQEYMHWHYQLNHASFSVIYSMSKSNLLPQHISSILHRIYASKQKPPLCRDCICAKVCRKQWRQNPEKCSMSNKHLSLLPGLINLSLPLQVLLPVYPKVAAFTASLQ